MPALVSNLSTGTRRAKGTLDRVVRRVRRTLVRARLRAVERVAREALTSSQTGGLTLGELGFDLPWINGTTAMIVGTNPYDQRITCLADLEEPGALPPGSFDAVVLANALHGNAHATVTANAFDALRAGGMLIASVPRRAAPEVTAAFESVARRRVGPWSVVVARRS
jgi:hypothetical protein